VSQIFVLRSLTNSLRVEGHTITLRRLILRFDMQLNAFRETRARSSRAPDLIRRYSNGSACPYSRLPQYHRTGYRDRTRWRPPPAHHRLDGREPEPAQPGHSPLLRRRQHLQRLSAERRRAHLRQAAVRAPVRRVAPQRFSPLGATHQLDRQTSDPSAGSHRQKPTKEAAFQQRLTRGRRAGCAGQACSRGLRLPTDSRCS
jgi:hypothetical protein